MTYLWKQSPALPSRPLFGQAADANTTKPGDRRGTTSHSSTLAAHQAMPAAPPASHLAAPNRKKPGHSGSPPINQAAWHHPGLAAPPRPRGYFCGVTAAAEVSWEPHPGAFQGQACSPACCFLRDPHTSLPTLLLFFFFFYFQPFNCQFCG